MHISFLLCAFDPYGVGKTNKTVSASDAIVAIAAICAHFAKRPEPTPLYHCIRMLRGTHSFPLGFTIYFISNLIIIPSCQSITNHTAWSLSEHRRRRRHDRLVPCCNSVSLLYEFSTVHKHCV